MYILGISGNFYRGSADAAAVLLRDGTLVAAAEEERFIRVKHAPSQCQLEGTTEPPPNSLPKIRGTYSWML